MFLRTRFIETRLVFVLIVIVIVSSYLIIEYKLNERRVVRGRAKIKSSTSTVRTSTRSAQQLASARKHVTKSLSELGPVPELSAHVIFFNRIPKTGSEMLVLLIQWLQGQNNFRHVRLKGGKKRQLQRIEQEILVDEVHEFIKKEAVPITFDRHVYFVNFTSFDKQSPTFINLIRDPVDKVISRFYYGQATPNPKNPDLKYAPDRTFESVKLKTLEECVVAGDSECHFITGRPYDLTIPYFCGHDPKCMLLNDPWALQMAKANVERYYPVVGVLEELNSTFEMLEYALPYFFKGVQNIYFKDLLEPYHNKNKKKPRDVDYDVKRYLKESLLMEYEFYEWVRARLFRQLQIMYGNHH